MTNGFFGDLLVFSGVVPPFFNDVGHLMWSDLHGDLLRLIASVKSARSASPFFCGLLSGRLWDDFLVVVGEVQTGLSRSPDGLFFFHTSPSLLDPKLLRDFVEIFKSCTTFSGGFGFSVQGWNPAELVEWKRFSCYGFPSCCRRPSSKEFFFLPFLSQGVLLKLFPERSPKDAPKTCRSTPFPPVSYFGLFKPFSAPP